MGEAKRRKKLSPNFGQIQLEVQLKPNIELPVELEKLKQILLKEGKKWEVGEVSIKGKTYPAVFMPFTKYYQGRLKLYSQVAFAPDCQLKMSQKLIDRISQAVCLQLKDKHQKERPHSLRT